MTPETYIECLTQAKAPQEPVTGLHGRIIRGHSAVDFETLSNDTSRLIVYLTDSEGLAVLLQNSDSTHDMLKAIGYDDGHISRLKNDGTQFKVAVFPEAESYAADWDGMLDLVSEVYPETKPYCDKYRDRLKNTPFTHYEVMADFDFGDHDTKEDPRFMSYDYRPECNNGDTWLKSSRNLVDLRRLLYHTIHCRELYRGDGFTEGPDGQRNVREFLLPNKRIDEINGAELADLPPL